MKIQNMGQKYVTPKVRDMARPVPRPLTPIYLIFHPFFPHSSTTTSPISQTSL